ncbi:MAG: class I SAM-dependent methyltransferase [Planctomycetota bacterium]
MNWRDSQESVRRRLNECYDKEGVQRYESWIAQLGDSDDQACLADLAPEFQFTSAMRVLDAGAGTGAMCRTILSAGVTELIALEPCASMIEVLRGKPELSSIVVEKGFCDSTADRGLFPQSRFDVIVSRQLVNGLYDPFAAFHNWSHWLRSEGYVVVIDGIYDRDAWRDVMDVDHLPLGACRTMATVPYLLEASGFDIVTVKWMAATNELPLTRTPRYVVIARKGVQQ